MKGDGIRQKVTVTGGTAAKRDPRLDKAVAAYRTYAQAQADETLPKVKVVHRRRAQAATSTPRKKAYAALPHRLGAHRAGRRVLR